MDTWRGIARNHKKPFKEMGQHDQNAETDIKLPAVVVFTIGYESLERYPISPNFGPIPELFFGKMNCTGSNLDKTSLRNDLDLETCGKFHRSCMALAI